MSWATRRTEPTPTPEPAPPQAPVQATVQPQRNAKRPARRNRQSAVPAPETDPEPVQSAQEPPQEQWSGPSINQSHEPGDTGEERPGIAATGLSIAKRTTIAQATDEDREAALRERDLGSDTASDAEQLIEPEKARKYSPLTLARILGWRRAVVAAARLQPNLSAAARATGVSRRHLTKALAEDAVFYSAVMEAYAEGADKVKSRLWHLGVEGTQEPVFHMGNEVARVTKYEVRALELLGKVHFPGEFASNSAVTVNTVPGAGGITNNNVTVNVGTDLLAALHARRRNALDGTKPVTGTVIEPAAQLPDAVTVAEA